jgi:hypothetical protein
VHLREAGLAAVETFNLGIPGYSVRDILALYYDRGAALQPDLVLIQQGWEDRKAIAEEMARQTGEPVAEDPRRSVAFQAWQTHLETLIWRILQDGTTPILLAQPRPKQSETPDLESLLAESLASLADRFEVPLLDLRSIPGDGEQAFAQGVEMHPVASRRLAIALAAELAPLVQGQGVERTPETSGFLQTVALWSFEGEGKKVRDRGPYRLEGRLSGGAVRQRTGYQGKGVLFQGVGGGVKMVRHPSLDLRRNFHLGVWVNRNRHALPGTQGLVVKGGAYHLELRDGRPAFYGYGLDPAGWHQGPDPVPETGWHFVTASFQNGHVTLTLNGVLQYRAPVTGEIQVSTRPLVLADGSGLFRGKLDEVWITEQLVLPEAAAGSSP